MLYFLIQDVQSVEDDTVYLNIIKMHKFTRLFYLFIYFSKTFNETNSFVSAHIY